MFRGFLRLSSAVRLPKRSPAFLGHLQDATKSLSTVCRPSSCLVSLPDPCFVSPFPKRLFSTEAPILQSLPLKFEQNVGEVHKVAKERLLFDPKQMPKENTSTTFPAHQAAGLIEQWFGPSGNETPENFKRPAKLAAPFLGLVEEETVLKEALKGFYRRWCYRNNPESEESLPNKNFNTLVGLYSGPGVGKSLALTLIASLGSSEARFDSLMGWKTPLSAHDEAFKKTILSSVGITVTYNVGTHVNEEFENESNWDEFFGWRIVHSYFSSGVGKASRGDFFTFVSVMRSQFFMSTDFAINVVQAHQRKLKNLKEDASVPIILCVDEIMISPSPVLLLKKLGYILDSHKEVNVSVSTLDTFLSRSGRASTLLFSPTDRHYQWVPLRSISLPGVLRLFSKYEPLKNPHLFSVLCNANGHARTLELIELCLRSSKGEGRVLDAIRSDVSLELSRTANLPKLEWDHVKMALSGELFDLQKDTALLDGEQRSIRTFIERGYFLNSMTEASGSFTDCILKMSLLQINSKFLMRNEDEIFYPLRQLVQLPIPPVDALARASWFEQFHSYWEILRRLVALRDLKQPQEVSLAKGIYKISSSPGAMVMNDKTERKGAFFLHGVDTNIIVDPTSPPIKKYCDPAASSWKNILSSPFDYVFHLGGSHPGSDIVIFENTPNGPIVQFIECKYSNPSSTTTYLQFNDYKKKIRLIVKSFNKFIKGKNLPNSRKKINNLSQVYCVFVVAQNTSDTTLEKVQQALNNKQFTLKKMIKEKVSKKEPSTDSSARVLNDTFQPNVIVIRRDHLFKLYTPTLNYIPEFLAHEDVPKDLLEENKKLPST